MIAVALKEHCLTITVDDLRPLSRYDTTFAGELRDAVVDASDADDVKAIILRVDGPDFCAPTADSPLPPTTDIWTGWTQAFATASALYQSVCFSKKVMITEVQGECAGAGSMLVLCSDLTVTETAARFHAPFAAHPEANFVLASLSMRLNRAKTWMLRERALTAAEAEDVGLVNAVVDRSRLEAAARGMANAAARMPLDGVTMSKMMLQAVLDAHGVGREFDMAGFYAAGHPSAAISRGVRA